MSDTDSESPAAAGDSGPGEDERAELERLRAEAAKRRRRRRIGWRTPLIVLSCLDNVTPLIYNPPVQNALIDKVTYQIISHLDVTGDDDQAAAVLNGRVLPRVATLLQSFGPALASAVTAFIHSTVRSLVTSPQFANAWIQVNRVAHQALVTAPSGGKGAVSTKNGHVTIDRAPFIDIVKQNMSARGFTLINKLPEIHPTVALGLIELVGRPPARPDLAGHG